VYGNAQDMIPERYLYYKLLGLISVYQMVTEYKTLQLKELNGF
jgi:hypothetical protein